MRAGSAPDNVLSRGARMPPADPALLEWFNAHVLPHGDRLRAWLAARGAKLTAIEQPRTTLDRIFLQHVGGRNRDAKASAADATRPRDGGAAS